MDRDLDAEEDVLDMDAELSFQDRDLDDDVPEAEAEEEEEWQHTDTELEESEMDISLLPGPAPQQGQLRSSIGQRSSIDHRSSGMGMQTRESVRRISGNAAQHLFQTRNTRAQAQQAQTPGTIDSSLSFGLSSGPIATADSDAAQAGNGRRSWLNAASARRNLFGGGRTTGIAGRLFTPTNLAQQPQQQQHDGQQARGGNVAEFVTPEQSQGQLQMSPRRSGRLLDAMRRRRGVDRDSLD